MPENNLSYPTRRPTDIEWQPVKSAYFTDEAVAEEIYLRGYKVLPWFDGSQIDRLRAIYEREHQLVDQEGGMFYAVYSRDYAYRQRIHEEIAQVMLPTFAAHFVDFENVINFFVTKLSGPASEFPVHQDMTALDEFRYSPLSIWTPLQDTTPENGAMSVVEKSHWFFSPFRGMSMELPFSRISETIHEYLRPVYMKKGEALLFDPRILHHSMPNESGKDRVAIVSGIFPKGYEFITCFRAHTDGAPIELFKQPQDWLLKYPNFLHDCCERPVTGEVIGTVGQDFAEMTEADFRALCAANGIEPVRQVGKPRDRECNMIGEPITAGGS